MKKIIASAAIILTITAIIFSGTTVPVSAKNLDEIDHYEISSSEKVTGTKHFLALRTEPEYADDNIIGELHNGDSVEVIGPWDGKYVWVYSDKHGCCGWVNSDYLK